jgi:hypothetical protein
MKGNPSGQHGFANAAKDVSVLFPVEMVSSGKSW